MDGNRKSTAMERSSLWIITTRPRRGLTPEYVIHTDSECYCYVCIPLERVVIGCFLSGPTPYRRSSNRRKQHNNDKQESGVSHSHAEDSGGEEGGSHKSESHQIVPFIPSSQDINSSGSSGGVDGDPSIEANMLWYSGVCLRWTGTFGFAKGASLTS
jgi:hypothetical protein